MKCVVKAACRILISIPSGFRARSCGCTRWPTRSPRRFFSVTGCMVAVLYWVEFAWWARWFSYFVALPFLVQFADEAVERWRVLTGKPGVDW